VIGVFLAYQDLTMHVEGVHVAKVHYQTHIHRVDSYKHYSWNNVIINKLLLELTNQVKTRMILATS